MTSKKRSAAEVRATAHRFEDTFAKLAPILEEDGWDFLCFTVATGGDVTIEIREHQ